MPIGGDDVVLVIKGSNEIIKLAKSVGAIERLKYLAKMKHHVLLLGATGTGKTNFLHSLVKPLPSPISNIDRTENVEETSLDVRGTVVVVHDTPGQEFHDARRRRAYLKMLQKPRLRNKYVGIINVVSYGYHETKTGKSDALLADGRPNPDYLSAMRDEELNRINEWLGYFDRSVDLWLITLVTKADLWWDVHDSVIDYYETGIYGEKVKSIFSGHSVLGYCSVIHRFYGESSRSGMFDDSDRIELRRHAIRTMLSLLGKKSRIDGHDGER